MHSSITHRERWTLTLLLGQVLFFGIAQGTISVAAYTLFVDRFGAQMLPYAYWVTAVSISITFYGITWLQQRLALINVLVWITSALGLLFFAAWYALYAFSFQWIAFALIPITIFTFQLGFILPGLQVGRLFNVRQVKRLYPIVSAGLTMGYIVGSFGAPFLTAQTHSIASIMLGASLAVLVSFCFLVATALSFKTEFLEPAASVHQKTKKTVWQLIQNRYIFLIISIQMMTTIVWHIAEFIYIEQVEFRFAAVEDLSAFIGMFGAARNVAAITVMLFVAGRLLNRYGLRLGLLAGPIGVGVGMLAIVAASLISGPESATIFWVAILTFGIHMVMEEGFTIPALKTSYQLLSKSDRVTTEAMVEGIGMSIAVGISGSLLLAFSLIPRLTITHTTMLALAVVACWIGVALHLYGDYARLLVQQLSRRMLDEASLTMNDGVNQKVIDALIESGDLGRITLALNVLENRHESILQEKIVALTQHANADIRAEAFRRVERLYVQAAQPAVQQAVKAEHNLMVKSSAIRALGALNGSGSLERMLDYIHSPESAIRQGALVGLLKHGGADGIAAASKQLIQLARDPNATTRAKAAQIIGESETATLYQPLLPLLTDADRTVRQIALSAAATVKHPALLPFVIQNLSSKRTIQTEAAITLKAYGDDVLPVAIELLERVPPGANVPNSEPLQIRTNSNERQSTERQVIKQQTIETACKIVNVCGRIGGNAVTDDLIRYLDHPNQKIEYAIHTALSISHYTAKSSDNRADVVVAMQRIATRCLYILVVQDEIGQRVGAGLLHSALNHAFIESRRQIFYLLSMLYDARGMRRAEKQITYGSLSVRAFALEMLDVTLLQQHRAIVWPLVNESLSPSQRIQLLRKRLTVKNQPPLQRIRQLMHQPQIEPAAWIQTCALFAVGQERLKEVTDSVEGLISSPDPLTQETAKWALARLLAPTHSYIEQSGRGPMYLTLEKVAMLKTVDIFAETPEHILASVAAIVEVLEVGIGETFIEQNDVGDCMYLIIDGEVLVHQGKDEILTLGPGKSVGELAILDTSLREASVTATQQTQLFHIDKETFDEVLTERPEIAQSVIRALSQRVRMTTAARRQ